MERLKVVSTEKKKTNKCMAVQLGVAPPIVTKRCTNVCQPYHEILFQIADNLDVMVQEKTKNKIQK